MAAALVLTVDQAVARTPGHFGSARYSTLVSEVVLLVEQRLRVVGRRVCILTAEVISPTIGLGLNVAVLQVCLALGLASGSLVVN